jgi:hypothetical protein
MSALAAVEFCAVAPIYNLLTSIIKSVFLNLIFLIDSKL